MSKTVKYKLIDKEGFLVYNPHNKSILENNGTTTFEGYCTLGNGLRLLTGDFIGNTELEEFFEKIEELLYWDGESELEVGMVVEPRGFGEAKIRYIEGKEVVAFVEGFGIFTTNVNEIRVCEGQGKKGEAFKKFLTEWKGHDMMTYAFDTKDSKAPIAEVFDFTYDFLLNEGLLNE